MKKHIFEELKKLLIKSMAGFAAFVLSWVAIAPAQAVGPNNSGLWYVEAYTYYFPTVAVVSQHWKNNDNDYYEIHNITIDNLDHNGDIISEYCYALYQQNWNDLVVGNIAQFAKFETDLTKTGWTCSGSGNGPKRISLLCNNPHELQESEGSGSFYTDDVFQYRFKGHTARAGKGTCTLELFFDQEGEDVVSIQLNNHFWQMETKKDFVKVNP
jgi:hypothetical protein